MNKLIAPTLIRNGYANCQAVAFWYTAVDIHRQRRIDQFSDIARLSVHTSKFIAACLTI